MKGGRMPRDLFDSSKLRGRIVEKYGTISNFSKQFGKDRSTISLYLNGGRGLSRENIILFCDLLDIDKDRIGDYFFTSKVVKT
jgi:hypothetical protein